MQAHYVITPLKIEKLLFYVENISQSLGKQITKTCKFLWVCLLNMLENDNSNSKTKFAVHIISNIFKVAKF